MDTFLRFRFLNLCALDDAEETYVVCAGNGDIGNRLVLPVKSAGKGLSDSADAGEVDAGEIQIIGAAYNFAQRRPVRGVSQGEKLLHGVDGLPLEFSRRKGNPMQGPWK